MEPAFKITRRYSLGTNRGQRESSCKGLYVFESQRKQWWSLPLKSLEDNLLDLAKFERESWVKGV